MNNDLLDIINSSDFARLFINKLGWNQPTRAALTIAVDDTNYTLTEVAEYRGLGVWHCPTIPNGATKRAIDKAVANETIERLIIYTHDNAQEWCWPRINKYRHSGAPTLVAHPHTVGEPNPDLIDRLERIRIKIGTQPTVVDVLNSMREAFDREAETASVQAARLMGTLYVHLAEANMAEKDASLFLARVLFLMFGDDTEMWGHGKRDLFLAWLQQHAAEDPDTFAAGLIELFDIADTPPERRALGLEPVLAAIPYINGGIFDAAITIPPLGEAFHEALIDACGFDWGRISPAVFGSMFQTVKDKDARRLLGEHYTSETNILRTIEPLFLTDLREQLRKVWNDSSGLRQLHNQLGKMRFLDPACGCGNFLIVTYRELRSLELELLKRRNELELAEASASGNYPRRKTSRPGIAQMSFDPTHDLLVTLDQFHGIEIEAWPAKIAETAMFLVDHLANKAMEDELGIAPHRLPIRIAPHIHNTDALTANWAAFLPPSPDVYVFGNPPFLGISLRSAAQTQALRGVWGDRYHGTLDYVTAWHAKALDYFHGIDGHWAFVTTNSITQGEAVAPLFAPIVDAGWRIPFAHRTFTWQSETPGAAAVHCVIVGFSRTKTTTRLFDHSAGTVRELPEITNITPYLTNGPTVIVYPHTRPLNPQIGTVAYGNKPTDGGHLIVEAEDHDQVASDPIAAKYLRRFIGARELLHGTDRYCLWLKDAAPADIKASPILTARVEAVREFRAASKAASTREAAQTPHLFRQIAQPDTPYLCIPAHVSETRPYFLAARFESDVITSNANFLAVDDDGFIFAVIASTMFITWQKTVGGRLESRLRFNKLLTWNTFPLPAVTSEQRKQIIQAGQAVHSARSQQAGVPLADLYTPGALAPALLAAHAALDAVIDPIFDISAGASMTTRQGKLFESYAALTGG